MKKIIVATALLFVGLCTAQSIQEVEDFSKIKIDTEAQVEIVHSSKSQLVFNKNSKDLKSLNITSDHNSLVITQNSKNSIPGLKIRIYTNDIEALSITGNSKVTLTNFTYQDRMVILAKKGAVVNTGDTEIKELQILRSNDSKVISTNAKTTNETVDGVLVATD
ncbi:hypothetical protein F0365_09200 [Nonlabens sp. Ci31]|jgi:hypothetical protein|uniref:GIN domain-containing protein n=1 Tax=Nonlabens sp. Ci31 TaxID=2608253 RepID=UPI001463C457|nr:DUF2807 domain-containing protein [Nonlabens sp. Ci31]QJP34558.1 hypothetical protein F0365_09200 [Nonlabens sp. Ci31]